jgi:type I restriction enzyme S subunit
VKQIKTLGDCAYYVEDKANASSFKLDDYVGVDNLIENKMGREDATYIPDFGNVTNFQANDLLIGNIRPYLRKIWLADRDGGSSPDVLTLRSKPGINPRFLYYSLLQDRFFDHMMNGRKGTKMPRGDKDQILKFSLPDFSPDMQDQVVEYLLPLDKKISINEEIVEKSEQLAQLIFRRWFIDYKGDNQPETVSRGLEMVWNSAIERNVPKNWQVVRLSSILKIESGFPFKSDSYEKQGRYKIITIKNVKSNRLDTIKVDYLDLLPANFPESCNLKVGEVLISLTGNVGRVCLVDEENLLLNQRVGKFACSTLHASFLYLYFQRPEVFTRINNLAGGSSQANLSPVDITRDFVVLPDEKMLNDFNAFSKPLINQIISLRQENRVLRELRETWSSYLFS